MSCKFEEVCSNQGTNDCEVCHHNPQSCTLSYFNGNGIGTMPTDEELEEEVY